MENFLQMELHLIYFSKTPDFALDFFIFPFTNWTVSLITRQTTIRNMNVNPML